MVIRWDMSAASLSVNAVAEVFQMEKVNRVKIPVFGVAVQWNPFQGSALQQGGEGTDGVFSAHGTDAISIRRITPQS